MRDQLPEQKNIQETGIIDLDGSSGMGTHWVAYEVDPRGVVYLDSYGLAPSREFLQYISSSRMHSILPWQQPRISHSTLLAQTLTDPPICSPEVLAVLNVVSRSSALPHKAVHEYTSRHFKQASSREVEETMLLETLFMKTKGYYEV